MWAGPRPQVYPLLNSYETLGENGVYHMYHGTSKVAASSILNFGFLQSGDGMLGRGVYLSRDLQEASKYPACLPDSQKCVVAVLVNVGRVITITDLNHPLQKTWHDNGYDTACAPQHCSACWEVNCVWDPSRITVLNVIYITWVS